MSETGERKRKFDIGDTVSFDSREGGGRLQGEGVIRGWTHGKENPNITRYRVRTLIGDTMISEERITLIEKTDPIAVSQSGFMREEVRNGTEI